MEVCERQSPFRHIQLACMHDMKCSVFLYHLHLILHYLCHTYYSLCTCVHFGLYDNIELIAAFAVEYTIYYDQHHM